MIRQAASIVVITALVTILAGLVGALLQPHISFGAGSWGTSPGGDVVAVATNNTHVVVIASPHTQMVSEIVKGGGGLMGQASAPLDDTDVITTITAALYPAGPLQVQGAKLFFADYVISVHDYSKLITSIYAHYTSTAYVEIPYRYAQKILQELRGKATASIEILCANATHTSTCTTRPVEISLREFLAKTQGKTRELIVVEIPLNVNAVDVARAVLLPQAHSAIASKTLTLGELLDYVKKHPESVPSAKPLSYTLSVALDMLISTIELRYTKSYILIPTPRLAARMGFLGVIAAATWIAACKYMQEPCTPRIRLGILSKLGKKRSKPR